MANGGPECGAKKHRSEELCGQSAGWGTDHPGIGHCRKHAGNAPSSRKAAARILYDRAARAMMAEFAQPLDVTPEEFVLSMVREAAGNVAWLGARVHALLGDDGRAIPSSAMAVTVSSTGQAGQQRASSWGGYDKGDPLFGPVIEIDRSDTEHVVGEELRGMVKFYNEERDRGMKFAKDAISLGIAKAAVEVAVFQAQQLVMMFNRVISGMGLPEPQAQLGRELMAREMRGIPEAK